MNPPPEPTQGPTREHAIDAVRAAALLMLIVYHASILFQDWAVKLFWVQNDRLLHEMWWVMQIFNIWRLPILFFVSGMGVRFAMQRRTNTELLKERFRRIVVPYIAGALTVGALSNALSAFAFGQEVTYMPSDYHLWFLGNIAGYVLLTFPLFRWLKNRPNGAALNGLRWLLRTGLFVPVFAFPGAMEAAAIQPEHFASFAHTNHGVWFGGICFCFGFLSASVMQEFKAATANRRWRLTALALCLWAFRASWIAHDPELGGLVRSFAGIDLVAASNSITALESMVWILAVMGHAFRHWHRGFPGLPYLSAAVYPIYIVHQPIQNALALALPAVQWNPWVEFGLIVAAILGLSVAAYEGIRRVRWLRPLFGVKPLPNPEAAGAATP